MSKPFNETERKFWSFSTTQNLHGDVIVETIENLPNNFEDLKKEPNDALAYGESTCHLHKLFRIPNKEGADLPHAFDLRIADDGIKFLKVLEPIELKHQEHTVRVIPPGIYRVKPQREYDPFTKIARQVAD